MIESKLKSDRYAVTERLLRRYGIEYSGAMLISMWDMAFNINNTWNAVMFISSGKRGQIKSGGHQNFSLEFYEIHKLHPAIRHSIKGTKIKLRTASNGTEFLVLRL